MTDTSCSKTASFYAAIFGGIGALFIFVIVGLVLVKRRKKVASVSISLRKKLIPDKNGNPYYSGY